MVGEDKKDNKLFSDGVWGGRENALEKAIEWRDEIAKIKKIPLEGKIEKVINGGVSKSVSHKINGISYHGYVAHIWDRLKQEQRRKEFSIAKYGNKEARIMAEQHLIKMRNDLMRSNKQTIDNGE